MQRLEFLDLLLEDADVVHEGDHPVGGHRRGVEAGGGQQRRHVQRHGALRRVQDKQFAPHEPEQRHLVSDLQVGEEGDVSRPLDRREEQSRGQLADVVDAHDVVGLHALAVARRRVRLGPQEQRDVARKVRVAVHRVAVRDRQLAGEARRLRRWYSPSLHR